MSGNEQEVKAESFEQELAALINKYSLEGNSHTPDFILAKYVKKCLNAFEAVVTDRDRWYGFDPNANLLAEPTTDAPLNERIYSTPVHLTIQHNDQPQIVAVRVK